MSCGLNTSLDLFSFMCDLPNVYLKIEPFLLIPYLAVQCSASMRRQWIKWKHFAFEEVTPTLLTHAVKESRGDNSTTTFHISTSLQGTKTTILYLMEFLVLLQPIEEDLECEILRRLVEVLTHKSLAESPLSSISSEDVRASVNSITEMSDVEKFGLFRYNNGKNF